MIDILLQTLIVVDENTEIMYNISAESAGGLVSARDFISIRRWIKVNDKMYVVASTSCTLPDMPAQKKYVRYDESMKYATFTLFNVVH